MTGIRSCNNLKNRESSLKPSLITFNVTEEQSWVFRGTLICYFMDGDITANLLPSRKTQLDKSAAGEGSYEITGHVGEGKGNMDLELHSTSVKQQRELVLTVLKGMQDWWRKPRALKLETTIYELLGKIALP